MEQQLAAELKHGNDELSWELSKVQEEIEERDKRDKEALVSQLDILEQVIRLNAHQLPNAAY